MNAKSSQPLAPTTNAPGASPTGRWIAAAALALCAAYPLIGGNAFEYHVAIMVCIAAIATGGLAIIAWVGQLSLAHGAFVGIGAYCSTLLVTRLGMPVMVGLPAAAIVAGLVAYAIGSPLLRLRGVYFVLITFALNELFRLAMLAFPGISGGSSGLANIPPISLFGVALESKQSVYIFALGCLAVVMALMWLLRRGPMGRAFASVEENLVLAESAGVPTARVQSIAFTIGSAIAGFAGAIMAHYIGFISPETFAFQLSVSYVIMLVVGGRLALFGALLGALFLTPLPEFLRGIEQYQHIAYGVILIVVLRFLPRGLMSLSDRLRTGKGDQA